MLRSLAKTVIAGTLHRTGLERIARPRLGAAPLVITYHQVVDDFAHSAESSIPSMLISTRMLARQIEWLGRRFRFVSLDEAGELARGKGSRRGKPAVALTFDDGYRQVYEMAFPLLRRKGIPAGLFVVTRSIGGAEPFIHDRLFLLLRRGAEHWHRPAQRIAVLLARAGVERDRSERLAAQGRCAEATPVLLDALDRAELERLLAALEQDLGPCPMGEHVPLSWDMVAEMAAAGFAIGSHTLRHVWMTNEDRETLDREAADSRSDLELRLGRPVEHFAYPGGAFDARAVQAVERAGYRFGYTVCPHRDARRPLLTIPRKVFWERTCVDAFDRFSGSIMSCQVRGIFGNPVCEHRRRRLGRSAA